MSREEEDKRTNKERSRKAGIGVGVVEEKLNRSNHSTNKNKDRDAKARARRERSHDKGELKPGAVRSSSNHHSESRESRKSRHHSNAGKSKSPSRSSREDADRNAKQRAKAGGRDRNSTTVPGASRSRNGSDQDAKRKAKMGSSRARTAGSRSSDRDEKIKAKSRSRGNNKEDEHAIQVDKVGANGEVQLEAVAVEDDEENQELKSKNAEIERLRRQMETMANQQQTTEEQPGQTDEDANTSSSSKWKIICVILVLLAVAGGVAGYIFATRESPAETPQSQESPTPAPTEGLTITTSTPAPTILSSNNPTDMILYPAPNEDDCKAIASGSTVQGQDDLYTSEYVIDIDATLALGVDEESLRSNLNESMQSKLFPAAAGCSLPILRRLVSTRNLEQSVPNFVIANGKIIESTIVAGECLDDPFENCFRVNITFVLWLRDQNSKPLYVLTHLVETLGDSPVDFLDLRSLLSDLVVIGAYSISPTDPPSRSPSLNPTTEQPSLSPTEATSSHPSFAPVVGPTTSRPTRSPTKAPTISPTATPTVAPVVAPVVPMATDNPTTSPTTAPVVVPTLAPVVGPSPPPTQFPSESPSDSPSPGPSPSPSSVPSLRPSSAPSASPSGRPSDRPSQIDSDPPTISLPLWEFQIFTDHPSITDVERTTDTITASMYDNSNNLVISQSFEGVDNPGVTFSANVAPDVTRVTVSNNGDNALFIDHAVLSKDGTSVKQWGNDDGLDGYCVSTELIDNFPLSNGSGSSTVRCNPSHDFEVVEPLWEFELFIDYPGFTFEATVDTVTVDMYGDHGLVKSSSFAGVSNPGVSVSANGPDVTHVTVSINGDDGFFIDYAVLSKDGSSVKQWGTNDSLNGYGLSTDPADSFLLSNGSGSTRVRCNPSHDFEVVEPLWEFELFIDYPGFTFEATVNTVTVDMYGDHGLVKSSSFAGVSNPGVSVSANGPDVTHVTVSINGDDGFFIDYAVLSKDGSSVKQWGTNDSLNGYGLSTDPADSFLLSNGSGSTRVRCNPSHDFEVIEPLWEFELFISHPSSGAEHTAETVTVDMYSDHGLVKSSSFAGVSNPGVSVSANGPDVSSVTVSINGDDAMFIDYAVLSKEGTSIKQWGTDDSLNGFGLSTDPADSFLLSNGASSNRIWCNPSHDFEVVD